MFPYPDPQYPADKSFFGHHELPSILFPFSPAAFNNDSIEALLPHRLLPVQNAQTLNASPDSTAAKQSPATQSRKGAPRKDRHSKICTAQGPRDRRMRLSLDVARRFFDLQDLLSFDKASKTVQWLLTMSDYAIKDLIPKEHTTNELSTSEYENISAVSNKKRMPSPPPPLDNCKPRRITTARKSAPQPISVKASRANARARARERTREKNRTKGGSTEDESGSTQDKSSLELAAVEVAQMSHSPSHDDQCKKALSTEKAYEFAMGEAGVGLDDDHIFDYSHDTISFLQEQCGMNIVANIEEQGDLMADVQFHATSWEVFNNPPIL